jgi:hypothetical protein
VPSLVIYDSGLEALPVGGLTGTLSPRFYTCVPADAG